MLFRIYRFYTKSFIKCNFSTDYNDGSFTILIESLKFRTNSRIIATYPVIYCKKCEYEFFEYYVVIIFLYKRSGKAWLKTTLPKNRSRQKFWSSIKECASMKTYRRENVKFIVTNFKDRFTLYITTTYPNMFSLGLYYF